MVKMRLIVPSEYLLSSLKGTIIIICMLGKIFTLQILHTFALIR